MNWNLLTDFAQLDSLKQESYQHPILIFKHSTRCSISASALGRLERHWQPAEVRDLKLYFLDLIAHRALSHHIAETFGVWHESPQVLLILNGDCVYDASHYDISFDNIKEEVQKVVAS